MAGTRQYIILCLMALQTIHLYAQDHEVTGRIMDAQSGEAIPDATIYINGTSNGSISDGNGQFILTELTLPCEFIISHIGYRLKSLILRDSTELKNLLFLLEPALFEIEEVTVMSDKLREKHILVFKDWFLGRDYKELGADILNDSVLLLNIQEDGQFEVRAQGPILVTIPKTGYLLSFDLVHFSLRYKQELDGYHCSILGYYYFDPVVPRSRMQQRRFARNRTSAYYNSQMHFCRSLYQGQLAENGYEVRRSRRCDPGDSTIYNPSSALTYSYARDPYGSMQLLLSGFQCNSFVVSYHYTGKYLPVDITGKLPSSMSVNQSTVQFAKDTVRIFPSGRVPDNSVLIGGSIGNKGIAYMLPEDYIPSMQ